ncbi:hypothetical protein JMUB5695_01365 [Mycobacterium heckeshornense]|uniref:hypothetical protein n=1 Tax=Mycobacterium heckeshornense TaxID=110505 RepID=UPI001944A0DC|nr:hypothetical protein [Mycobacterium heckeshornense]BCQ07940.1 hypothetical protein JMUB5695_01365 [Mycobacterium heckeshornense]
MAAQDELRVDLETLAYSASHAHGQGEDLAIAHVSSNTRMEAAQPGWVGSSAAALNARLTAWLSTSQALLTMVGEHALDLHNDARDFAAMERDNAEKLRAVAVDANGAAGTARD